ncbi:MAG: hypothetical protein KAX38_07285, partial [Candidatus Krumholzibacteria bacterium]|nr:hypothetical protein [Candidatus Krumholzibacteria bacterium]
MLCKNARHPVTFDYTFDFPYLNAVQSIFIEPHGVKNGTMKLIDLRKLIIENGESPPIHADLRTRFPEKRFPLIIVCHGFLGYKGWGFFPYLSEHLAVSGFHVLTISFSMNGIDEETGLFTRPEELARNTVTTEISDLRRTCLFARGRTFPFDVSGQNWGFIG